MHLFLPEKLSIGDISPHSWSAIKMSMFLTELKSRIAVKMNQLNDSLLNGANGLKTL